MISRRGIIVMMVAGLAMSDAAVAQCAEAAGTGESADSLIRQLGDDAVRMLANGSLTEQQREAEFHRLLLTGFDLDTISRLVLGRFWRQASDAQKSEFRSLFEVYVVKSYVARLGHYDGETFKVSGTRPGDGGDVMVQSEIDRPNGPPIHVEWRVRKEDAGYRIVDVFVDGISMMQTQRDEFATVIQNNGDKVDALLSRLRQQTAAKG
jgi:phospholipid transport system substrate-binding protein